MATLAIEQKKTEPIAGLARLDRIQNTLRTADAIIAELPPLSLHLVGPGNKYETEASARVFGISIQEARRNLVLTPNSDRIIGPHKGK